MPTKILYPAQVRSDEAGFNWLATVARHLGPGCQSPVVFDARQLKFFDANLCAPFGALLHVAKENGHTIDIGDVRGKVLHVWSKNFFMASFGGVLMADTFGTTLTYRHFAPDLDEQQFARYIESEMMSRDRDLPQMSVEMRREFANSIGEIFDNARSHSRSDQGIFGCGQLFPNIDRLSFTLCDLGVGFRYNVQQRVDQILSDQDAIEWATQSGHTTRAKSGGYGLALLRRFFARNKGRMQIVSGSGLWDLNSDNLRLSALKNPFPGSFVNLVVNTNDNSYHESLADQLNEPLF